MIGLVYVVMTACRGDGGRDAWQGLWLWRWYQVGLWVGDWSVGVGEKLLE